MARTRAAQQAEKKSLSPPQHTSTSHAASTTLAALCPDIDNQLRQPDSPPSDGLEIHEETETRPPAQLQSHQKIATTWECVQGNHNFKLYHELMRISAFSRYFSENTSSFPDYGAPQVTMKAIKKLNASGGGPVNTMSGQPITAARSSAHSHGQPTSRPKYPKGSSSPSIIVEIPSPNSSRSLTRADGGSNIAVGSMYRQSGDGTKKTYSKRGAKERPPYIHYLDGPRQPDRNLSIESVEDDVMPNYSPTGSRIRRKRSLSPDVITVDDSTAEKLPPAKIRSDLTRTKRPRPGPLVSQPSEKGVKRPKSQSLDEPDELQLVQSRTRAAQAKIFVSDEDADYDRHSKMDRKSAYFTSRPSKAAEMKEAGFSVIKAVGGNHYFVSDQDQRAPVFLRGFHDSPSVLSAVDHNNRRLEDLSWMDINLETTQSLLYSDCSHIQIKRPSTTEHPSSVVFQFDSSADAARLVSHFSPRKADWKDAYVVKNIFKTAMREASNRNLGTKIDDIGEKSRSPAAQDVDQPTVSANDLSGFHIQRGDKKVLAGQKDQSQVSGSRRLTRRSSDMHSDDFLSLQPRRTRHSAPAVIVDEDVIRWTDLNHDWTKDWQQSLVWPLTGKNRTTVDKDDIYRLDEGEFLNDNLINFWIRYLQEDLEKKKPVLMQRVYCFSTFFFEKLKYRQGKIDFDGVRSWTSKVDIFSYDYLFVPVNENAHWYLAIVCNPGKLLPQEVGSERKAEEPSPTPAKVAAIEKGLSKVCLADDYVQRTEPKIAKQTSLDVSKRLRPEGSSQDTPVSKVGSSKDKQDPDMPRIITLDSLGSAHPKTCGALRLYLAAEAKDKKKVDEISRAPGWTARSIPQQDNWCDCGIYVLAYIEQFLEKPDESIRRILLKEPTDWTVTASEHRKTIRQLILVLQKSQQEAAEVERQEKLARRRAKGKARVTVSPVKGSADLKELSENDTTSASQDEVLGQTRSQTIEKPSPSPKHTAESASPSSPKIKGPMTLSGSNKASPSGDGSKNPSSSNSFHTATSSPALVDPAEWKDSAPGARPSKSSYFHKDVTPNRDEEIGLIDGLASSPTSVARDIKTSTSDTRKRKRVPGPDGSPTASLRRRKFTDQITDLRARPKKSIEAEEDNDGKRADDGVRYDGVDQRSEVD